MKKLNLEEVRTFIKNSSAESCVYIGADSCRYRKHNAFWAEYATVVVIHLNGKNGGKIFGEVTHERDFDQKKNRPSIRLMNEVMKASQLYLDLAESIGDRHCEIHLDINPNLMHGSSCVLHEAIGYVRGMTDKTPKLKPDAFAASFCADRFTEVVA